MLLNLCRIQEEDPVVDLGEDRQLPQFTLVGYTQHICDQIYTAGLYPCKEVRFVLRRDIGYYLIQVRFVLCSVRECVTRLWSVREYITRP